MAEFTAVSRERHGSKQWKPLSSFAFADSQTTVPVVAAELSMAVPAMPLAFVNEQERWGLAAVLSLVPGRNQFVDTAGKWHGAYLPEAFRSYPFRLLKPAGASDAILCVDEAYGLVADGTGEAFFNSSGTVSPALQSVLARQTEFDRGRLLTENAVAALAQAGLFAPWQIIVKAPEGERYVEGLYRINEAALGALPDDAFAKLRRVGALPIAYGQLFSMRQLNVFQTLAAIHVRNQPQKLERLPPTLDHLFDQTENVELRFD